MKALSFLIIHIRLIYSRFYTILISNDQLFSKILVPIDGSEPSFHAARVWINIANKFNSEIIVLYVVVAPSPSDYANLIGLVTPKHLNKLM